MRKDCIDSLFKKLDIIEHRGSGYEKIQDELKSNPEIKLQINNNSTFSQIEFTGSPKSGGYYVKENNGI